MAVTPKPLINSKFASNSNTTEYTTPSNTRTIIDKFTATNTDSGAVTLSVHIVESGASVGDSKLVIKTHSIAAGATKDFSELQNHILAPGDFISCVASVASKVVIRACGREAT